MCNDAWPFYVGTPLEEHTSSMGCNNWYLFSHCLISDRRSPTPKGEKRSPDVNR